MPTHCNTRLVAIVLLAAWACAGCSSAPLEPESALVAQDPQAYPFETIWTCMIEAAEAEGFELPITDRHEDSGEMITDIVKTFEHPLGERTEGQRVRVVIGPSASGGGSAGEAHPVSLAASKFLRAQGAWTYDGPDAELARRFWSTYQARVARRYEGGS